MSKGLEALERFKQPQMICDLDWDNRVSIIEKELKALEIIKNIEGFVDKEDFFYDDEEDKYYFFSYEITKEEYDLLKEVMTND